MPKDREQIRVVATNRKAHHLYHIVDTYEAGIALVGTEVKSLRQGKVNDQAGRFNHDPTRSRKLLLHRVEIKRLLGKTTERGFTLVPLKIYFKDKVAKLELALAIGKRLFDRRKAIKDREVQRELRRALKERQR